MAFRCSEVPCKLLQYTGVVLGVGVTTRSTRGLPVWEADRQSPEQLFPGTNPVPLHSGRNPWSSLGTPQPGSLRGWQECVFLHRGARRCGGGSPAVLWADLCAELSALLGWPPLLGSACGQAQPLVLGCVSGLSAAARGASAPKPSQWLLGDGAVEPLWVLHPGPTPRCAHPACAAAVCGHLPGLGSRKAVLLQCVRRLPHLHLHWYLLRDALCVFQAQSSRRWCPPRSPHHLPIAS